MANWCSIHYIVRGDKKELSLLTYQLKRINRRKTPINRFISDKMNVGNLIEACGGDHNKYYCKGYIDEWYVKQSNLHILIIFAYAEPYEIRHFLERTFPNLDFLYLAEESGSPFYSTNDVDGIFFPQRYKIERWDGDDDSAKYYNTFEEASKALLLIVGSKANSVLEAESLVNSFNETHQQDRLYFNKIIVSYT